MRDESEKERETQLSGKDFIKDLAPVTHYLSTGCTLLDLAIADRLPGGFAAGRIAQIYGAESVAKTVIGLEPLGSAQRQGGWGEFNDVEGTLDEARASLFGVDCADPKKWSYVASNSIEELFDHHINNAICRASACQKPCACTIDSLSALCSEVEQSEDLTVATMGTSRPRQLSKAFRKYIRALSEAKLALLFIDQTREAVGQTFGDKDTTSGGRALRFYASTRLKLSMEGKITNKFEKVVGVQIGFHVKKNKVATPYREGSFRLLFDYGIDDIATSLDWLHNNDPEIIKLPAKERKWTALGQSARGLNDLARKIEENSLERDLMKELERVWRLAYSQTESRVARKRVGDN